MPEPPVSLVSDVSVTLPLTGLPGLSMVALGSVLSMRRLETTAGDVSTLPALSVATERKSYSPSETAVVSNDVEYGELVSVSIVVQEPPLDGRRWKATEARPEPPVSPALAVSVTVWRRLAPGSAWLEVGAVVSDLASLEEIAKATFPALSATLYRYFAHLPDASVSGLVAAAQLSYDEHALFERSPIWRSSAPVAAFTSESGPLSVVIANEP